MTRAAKFAIETIVTALHLCGTPVEKPSKEKFKWKYQDSLPKIQSIERAHTTGLQH